MNNFKKTYLIGAGFSRSYSKDFPLSCDFFEKMKNKKIGTRKLLDMNPSLQNINSFLKRFFPYKADLEEVLSFLTQKYFPRDFRQHWQHRNDIYHELLIQIPGFLTNTTPQTKKTSSILTQFCKQIIAEKANIITFNYDCLIDRKLNKQDEWNPATGYGIRLRHATEAFNTNNKIKDSNRSKISLLKLHGSINWGTISTEQEVSQTEIFYSGVEGILEEDIGKIAVMLNASESMEVDLLFTPFIIPPILDKTGYYENKFLRNLWFLTHQCLAFSEDIEIIGYSFPDTDYFSRFLIREAFGSHLAQMIRNKRKVTIVNLKCDRSLKDKAKQLFIGARIEFIESDAFEYIENKLTNI